MTADIVDKLAASVLELDPLSDYRAFAKEAIEEIKRLRKKVDFLEGQAEHSRWQRGEAEGKVERLREALAEINYADFNKSCR